NRCRVKKKLVTSLCRVVLVNCQLRGAAPSILATRASCRLRNIPAADSRSIGAQSSLVRAGLSGPGMVELFAKLNRRLDHIVRRFESRGPITARVIFIAAAHVF